MFSNFFGDLFLTTFYLLCISLAIRYVKKIDFNEELVHNDILDLKFYLYSYYVYFKLFFPKKKQLEIHEDFSIHKIELINLNGEIMDELEILHDNHNDIFLDYIKKNNFENENRILFRVYYNFNNKLYCIARKFNDEYNWDKFKEEINNLKEINPEKKEIIMCDNLNLDQLKLLNKASGPYGDFYQSLEYTQKIKWFFPEKNELIIMTNDGDEHELETHLKY